MTERRASLLTIMRDRQKSRFTCDRCGHEVETHTSYVGRGYRFCNHCHGVALQECEDMVRNSTR
jgi:hypothetical protein